MADTITPEHLAPISRPAGMPESPMDLSMTSSPLYYDMTLANANFTFPQQSVEDSANAMSDTSTENHLLSPIASESAGTRRKAGGHKHRRTASNLPSFSFNAADSSGLDDSQPAAQPIESIEVESNIESPPTPSRRHVRTHTRNNSGFIGGDSRLGQANLMYSSAASTDVTSAPVPIPTMRSGHRRGQSIALSRHDVSQIILSPDQPRLSTSLPGTPQETSRTFPGLVDHSSDVPALPSQHSPDTDDSDTRPPSRREVTFSSRVEYIPRPLSTISSDTESSRSTIRGHSVNNSISSMLSAGIGSPASARVRSPSLEATPEHEPKQTIIPKDIARRIDKEGEWLKTRIPHTSSAARPLSEPAAKPLGTISRINDPAAGHVKFQMPHRRSLTAGHDTMFDRRKSEPTLSAYIDGTAHFSTTSLQEQQSAAIQEVQGRKQSNRRSSSKKFRDWAMSKFSRKNKDSTPFDEVLPSEPSTPELQPAVAESDLDAVFGSDASLVNTTDQPQQFFAPAFSMHPEPRSRSSIRPRSHDLDLSSSMIDLDAALGPFNTPATGSPKSRRQMHSSRIGREVNGFDQFNAPRASHRRAESAPLLARFDYTKSTDSQQSPMADVFEEDEEDDGINERQSRTLHGSAQAEDEFGIGVQVVDVNTDATNLASGPRGSSLSTSTTRLSAIIPEYRAPSLVSETILEESSPVDPIHIVQAHEEPRVHEDSAKSSDGSDTSTLLGPHSTLYSSRDSQQSLATPETFSAPSFSTTDFARRQGSFETSRAGTSASSMTDNRTMSSCTTGDHTHDHRSSVDDVPSLISSCQSTMMSTHANTSKRDISSTRTPSVHSNSADPVAAALAERRRKRRSIQSLSQLVGSPFGPRSHSDQSRPQTATEGSPSSMPKKEHKLKKFMFWKSKQRQQMAPLLPNDTTSDKSHVSST